MPGPRRGPGAGASFAYGGAHAPSASPAVHFALSTPLPNISGGMQRLLGHYAQGFNRRCDRRGHFVECRFGTVLVESDEQLLRVGRYIALNPVAAGACSRPEEWEWSSYRHTAGYAARPRLLQDDRLLRLLDDDRALAQLEWRLVLAEAIARGEHLKPRTDRPVGPGVENT